MFRRKEEDSLFDNQTEDQLTSDATATPSTQPSSSGTHSSASAPSQSSRFTPESRPTPQSQNSNFRTNAPASSASTSLPADITRNRMPEAKTTTSSSPISSMMTERGGKTIRRVLTVGSDI